MPERKGKRRRRPRSRPVRSGLPANEIEAPPAPAAGARPAPKTRRGWRPPFWVNVTLGVGMLVFGILFLVLPGNGGPSQKGLLFLGYMVVAGFYLVQAFRQYWAKRQAGR